MEVHLFSAVMIAALFAYWPTGADTLPTPPLDPASATALVLVLGYLARAVLSDLARLGGFRRWRMFTASTPSVVAVEITVLDARGGTAQWT